MSCPATLQLGIGAGGDVRLHCARTDAHGEHRAKFRGKLRGWSDNGPRVGWWFVR